MSLVSISPTGEYLALAMRKGDQSAFQVVTHPEREVQVNYLLGDDREVAAATWLGPKRVLATPSRRLLGSQQRARTGELVTIDVRSGKSRLNGRGFLLDLLPAMPNHFLADRVAADGRFAEAHRLDRRLSFNRQRATRVARSPAPQNAGGHFVVDASGSVAFAVGNTRDYKTVVHGRDRETQDWQLLHSYPTDDPGWMPLRFGPKPNTYYTSDSRTSPETASGTPPKATAAADTAGLGLYDASDGSHEMLFRHAFVDIGPLLCDFNCRRVYGVLVEHHYPRVVYLAADHPLARLHASLAKTYPEDLVLLTSVTEDHKQVVALVSGDRRPGDYFLVDADARSAVLLASRRPNLPASVLSPMTPVEITTRDGTTVFGLLTNPPQAPTPGPMVVLVHGGPHGIRDSWGFNAEVQLLASRGYHVLQVNYRGSGGYGVAYQQAGFGEWGRRIEDDVADGTRWAVQAGIADPKRVCVAGFSYGAYSALMGAVREPALYRCAIGGGGIYDLALLHKAGDMRRLQALLRYLDLAIGDEAEELTARSPVTFASRIKARVMLYHGTEDRRAPLAHAQRMREALQRSGNEPEWLLLKGHGHGIFTNRTRAEVYERMLAFLNANIGPGA